MQLEIELRDVYFQALTTLFTTAAEKSCEGEGLGTTLEIESVRA